MDAKYYFDLIGSSIFELFSFFFLFWKVKHLNHRRSDWRLAGGFASTGNSEISEHLFVTRRMTPLKVNLQVTIFNFRSTGRRHWQQPPLPPPPPPPPPPPLRSRHIWFSLLLCHYFHCYWMHRIVINYWGVNRVWYIYFGAACAARSLTIRFSNVANLTLNLKNDHLGFEFVLLFCCS